MPRFGRPTGDWDLIHGELVTFIYPLRDLPPIDRLEGFRPGGHSIYQRVMAAVLCGRTSFLSEPTGCRASTLEAGSDQASGIAPVSG